MPITIRNPTPDTNETVLTTHHTIYVFTCPACNYYRAIISPRTQTYKLPKNEMYALGAYLDYGVKQIGYNLLYKVGIINDLVPPTCDHCTAQEKINYRLSK